MSDTRTRGKLSDTSPKASKVYFERLAAMSLSERVRMGVALWEEGNSLQRAAIRRQYLDADEAEVCFRMAVSRFREKLSRAAYRKA
jgi:hypothetical protein